MYKLTNHAFVIRLSDNAYIPLVEDNSDYKEYLGWLIEGNIPLSADPTPPPSQDKIDAEAVNQYQKLVALKTMTPAKVEAWVDTNITNFAQAKDAIKTLAIAISVLARRI